MTLLYALPELLLIALGAGLLGGAMIGLPPLVQRIPVFRPTDPGFEFIIRMQAPLFTMAALALVFTLSRRTATSARFTRTSRSKVLRSTSSTGCCRATTLPTLTPRGNC